MLVAFIPDHVQQALDRLLQQYKDQPRIASLITALVQQIQDLEEAVYSLNAGRQIFYAVGTQLDGLGEIVGFQRNGLDDETYRVFLYGAIARIFSDTTITTIITILNLLLDTNDVLLFENFPAEVSVEFSGSTRDPSIFPQIAMLVQEALGAGINLGSMSEYDNGNAFTFDGGEGLGFGDANDASVGGKFAGVVYVHTGS